MERISTVGLDIAKKIHHLVCVNPEGKVLKREKFPSVEFESRIKNIGSGFTVALEACGGSHYVGRQLVAAGYDVKLIPAQHAAVYRLNQKNDYRDAEAICEASTRVQIKPVPIKEVERQEAQHLVRIRERVIRDKTALGNQLHGMLLEYGYHAPKGHLKLKAYVIDLISDETARLSLLMKRLLQDEITHLVILMEKLKKLNKEVARMVKGNPLMSRMKEIPGVGDITAISVYASSNEPKRFKNGRYYAAFLGLTPQQHSTGGKTRLGKIPKAGTYPLRRLLIHGARSVLKYASEQSTDRLSLYAARLNMRNKDRKLICVALANRIARILWIIMNSQESYNPDPQKKLSSSV